MLAPAALYATAVATMQSLAVPSVVTFDETLQSDAGTLRVSADRNGTEQLTLDSDPEPSTLIFHATSHPPLGTAAVSVGDAPVATIDGVFFDPTWRGVEAFVRGRIEANNLFAGLPGATPSPPASPAPSGDLPVIAVVSALAPAYYTLSDGGATACPDGTPGRALRATPRDPQRGYPLQSVIVNDAAQRFCSMTFGIPSSWGDYRTSATYEIHFGQRGAYWLVVGGVIHFVATRPLHRPIENRIGFTLSSVQASP
jgi:hypothetical protein